MIATNRLRTAVLMTSVLLALTGCTGTAAPSGAATVAPSITVGSTPTPHLNTDTDTASGTRPSGAPDASFDPQGAQAATTAGEIATTSREWITAWDAAECTGESAAQDVRECQVLLMKLANAAEGVSGALQHGTADLPDLADASTAADAVAAAASAWLNAWCGAYADSSCAQPGSDLVAAQRDLDTALDVWLPRSSPDA